MKNTRKIRVLNEFRPYFRLLKTYNRENFGQRDWRSSYIYAFITTLLVLSESLFILSGIWYLIENVGDLQKLVVSLPLVITLSQMDLTFITLITKNQMITEAIKRLQQAVDQRKTCIS